MFSPKEGKFPFGGGNILNFKKQCLRAKEENYLPFVGHYPETNKIVVIDSFEPLKFHVIDAKTLDFEYYSRYNSAWLSPDAQPYLQEIRKHFDNKPVRPGYYGALLTRKYHNYVHYKQYLACKQVGLSVHDERITQTFGDFKRTNVGSWIYVINRIDLKDGTSLYVKEDEELKLIQKKSYDVGLSNVKEKETWKK